MNTISLATIINYLTINIIKKKHIKNKKNEIITIIIIITIYAMRSSKKVLQKS